jgi:hypothetical protein
MKRIIFSIILLISLVEIANAQGERFVGTWLATDGNKSYKIAFVLKQETTKIEGEMVTATVLYGSVTYLNEGKVIRRIKSNATEKILIALASLSNAKIITTNRIFVDLDDKVRNSHGSFTAIISDDNNTLNWKYINGTSERINYPKKGEIPNQAVDIPHELTFKRISN